MTTLNGESIPIEPCGNERTTTVNIEVNDLSISLGERSRGGIEKLSAFNGGLCIQNADPARARLFTFVLKGPEGTRLLSNRDCDSFSWSRETHGANAVIRLEYSGFSGFDIRVSVVVEADGGNNAMLWRAELVNHSGLALTRICYPQIGDYSGLKGPSSEDFILLPVGEGRLYSDPGRLITETPECTGNCYPGDHSMQFIALYHRDGEGLYLGCRDTGGRTKKICLHNDEGEIHLGSLFYQEETPSASFTPDFDVVLKPFTGDWMDAAAIYRDWATRQWWCEKSLKEREDIPDWFKAVRPVISIENYATTGGTEKEHFRNSLDQIREWEREYSREIGPCTFFWTGWEHDGAWISPELFPPLEGDEPFDRAVRATHEMGGRLEAYFSTVLYIVKHGRRSPLLEEEGLGAAVLREDGRRDRYDRWWGQSTAMCLGADWWKSRLIEIVEVLANRDFDMIQLDMFPINAPRPCWDPDHGHPPGYGAWHMRRGIEIVEACRNAGRAIKPDLVISTEMPCETLIPYIDTYLSRDDWRDLVAPEKRTGYTAIPLFSFVYHEYMMTQGYEWSMIVLPSMAGTIAVQFARGKTPTAFEGWGAWDPEWKAPTEAERNRNRRMAWRLLKLTSQAASEFAGDIFCGGMMVKPPSARFRTANGTTKLDWDSTSPALGAFTVGDSAYLLILNADQADGTLQLDPNQGFPGNRKSLTVWRNGKVVEIRPMEAVDPLIIPLEGHDVVVLRFR